MAGKVTARLARRPVLSVAVPVLLAGLTIAGCGREAPRDARVPPPVAPSSDLPPADITPPTAQPPVDVSPPPSPGTPSEDPPVGDVPTLQPLDAQLARVQALIDGARFADALRLCRELRQEFREHPQVREFDRLRLDIMKIRRIAADLPFAIESLDSRDRRTLNVARRRLREAGGTGRIFLIKAVQESAPRVVDRAVDLLIELGDSSYVEHLGERVAYQPHPVLRSAFRRGLAASWATWDERDRRKLAGVASWGSTRRLIEFPGYRGETVLRDFPALIMLPPGARILPDLPGNWLRFVSADSGAELAFEVVGSPEAGVAAWVRIPELKQGSSRIWMYEGLVSKPPEGASAWGGAYVGVWHLDAEDDAVRMQDASPSRHHGENRGTRATAGIVHGARSFGGDGAHITMGDVLDFERTDSFTLSAWIKTKSVANQGVFGKMQGGPVHRGYDFAVLPDGLVKAHVISAWSINAVARTTSRGVADGNWRHVAATYDGSLRHHGLKLFIDGREATSVSQEGNGLSGPCGNAQPFCIGIRNATDGIRMNGAIDEARVSSVARSPDWIRAACLNVVSNSAFCRFGESESVSIAVIANGTPGAVMREQAQMSGDLRYAGPSETTGLLCWGATDGGTNLSDWAQVVSLPNSTTGALKAVLSPLREDSVYRYRFAASNRYGISWAAETPALITGEVRIETVDGQGSEVGPDDAVVRLSRPPGCAGCELRVPLRVGGSAAGGADYAALPDHIVMPAGVEATSVVVRVIDDHEWAEQTETVAVVLSPGGYVTGAATRATVTIEDNDSLDQWRHRMRIDVADCLGAAVLTNFPLLVRLGTNLAGFSYQQFPAEDHGDLSFHSGNGSEALPFEIESWNTGGISHVWVAVPELAARSSVWACWGRHGAPEATVAGRDALWTHGYELVLHMQPDRNGVAVCDASHRRRTLSLKGRCSNAGHGAVGSCLRLHGDLNDAVLLDSAAAVSLGKQWTLSAWFRNLLGPAAWRTLARGSVHDHHLIVAQGSHELGAYDSTAGRGFIPCGYALRPADEGWHHIAAVARDDSTRFYVDGVPVGAGPVQSRADIGCIGNYADGGQKFAEYLDEVRVESVARSPAWMRATWLNVASNGVLCTYGVVVHAE